MSEGEYIPYPAWKKLVEWEDIEGNDCFDFPEDCPAKKGVVVKI